MSKYNCNENKESVCKEMKMNNWAQNSEHPDPKSNF